MGRNILVDKSSGDKIVAEAGTMERVAGVEIGYIDWVIEEDEKFENGDWEVHFSPVFGDSIGTEDL